MVMVATPPAIIKPNDACNEAATAGHEPLCRANCSPEPIRTRWTSVASSQHFGGLRATREPDCSRVGANAPTIGRGCGCRRIERLRQEQ